MSCTELASVNILNDCDNVPVAGFEKKGWILNRAEFTATFDVTVPNLVTALTPEATKVAYTVTATKKEANGGFDLVVSDVIPDSFQHYFSFMPYDKTAAAIANMDDMNDLIFIGEQKGTKTEGTFVIYGLETGLYKSTASMRQNDNSGLGTYEFQSLEGQGERYSRYVFWVTDYSTTLAALVALETNP